MQARDVVLRFADYLVVGLGAVRSNSVGVGRRAIGEPLTFESGSGDRTRSLNLPDVGTANLHGRGCRIEFNSGADVDFDWDHENREVFDAWRIRRFARSLGQSSVSDEHLLQAMKSDDRFLETEPGWFTLVLLTKSN